MVDKLMYVAEVADRLRLSEGALRYKMHAGTAPKHAKLGGRVVFRESDVEAYIEAAFAEAP